MAQISSKSDKSEVLNVSCFILVVGCSVLIMSEHMVITVLQNCKDIPDMTNDTSCNDTWQCPPQ